MWLLIPSESARPAPSVGGLRRGSGSRQPGGEPERGANGGRGGGAPARPHALARGGADQAGPEPGVLEDAPGPAHVDWRSKRQGPHGVADVCGELRLARAGDHARGAVAATGPREDAWGEGGDSAHRVGGVDQAQDRGEITSRRQRAEPLTTEPEPRTLVADQGAEAARAGPAAAPIVGDHDRAGSREHEGARPVADRAEERRLGVRDHLDAHRQAAERVRQGAALAAGPEGPRRGDEGGNIAPAPALGLPDPPQQRRGPPVSPGSGRGGGPHAGPATRGAPPPRQAAERVRQGAALAAGPEGPRRDDESGNIATAPALALPDRPEQRREPSEIPVSGRDDGPDAALATRGRHTHPRAPNVHAYAEGKRGSWFSIPVNPLHGIR